MTLEQIQRSIMTKSNAQRQAAYRERHFKDIEGQGQRLNMVIDLPAKKALERMAHCYGVTQKQVLLHIINKAEWDFLSQLANGEEQDKYYDLNLQLKKPEHYGECKTFYDENILEEE